MHNTNVLILGPKSFNTSLEELKDYLNFSIKTTEEKLTKKLIENIDILIFHYDYFKNNFDNEALKNIKKVKILASHPNKKINEKFNNLLHLPMKLERLNKIVDESVIKKSFSDNSSIKIKSYILNKNEKKLSKQDSFILLTEKEIQFLELLLKNKQSVDKKTILEKVWNYSSSADTHTVETHIYRLRKKINTQFGDKNFILNDKKGYSV